MKSLKEQISEERQFFPLAFGGGIWYLMRLFGGSAIG